MSEKSSLAVVMLTHNEEMHLPRALRCIRHVAQEIFVVDSYSTDATVELARAGGATVLQHPFQNYARQYAWAMENAPITAEWVMRLDADEIVEEDLAEEIRVKLPALPPDVTGVVLNRKTVFQGRVIRHGGRLPLMLLRIWRRGKARIEDRWMDEHMYLTEGRPVTFKGGFADHSLRDLTFFTSKHNHYASREALEVLNQRMHLFASDFSLREKPGTPQAKSKRLIKDAIYNRIPYEISALLYFLYRYVLQLGFLDGREGLVYHVLQGFWYRFLVGAKLRELQRAVGNVSGREEVVRELERLTRQEIELK
ncbi:MAG TPA: glycosyltransferase family 2 protein [Terracidiphilus sp.]|nr:glycosyltransferase family 2 protein [Terracidiphilus sp.]